MIDVSKIKFGTLDNYELKYLQDRVHSELSNRERNPDIVVDIIRFEDGSEGFTVYPEKFKDINPNSLHQYISNVLGSGGSITISQVRLNKEEYLEYEAQYNWFEEDRPKIDFDCDDDDND